MGLNLPGAGMHTCPRRGCCEQVPNVRFACLDHWRQLSKQTREELIRTRFRHALDRDRRAVFLMAEADWEKSNENVDS